MKRKRIFLILSIAIIAFMLLSVAAVSTFIGLSDTPNSYTGEGGKYLKVNPGETALIFDTAAGVSDHGALTGLADDDHTQYILADGTRAFSAYVDIDEIVPPGNPAADKLRLYAEDYKGFSFFSFRDSTGMVRKVVRDSVFVGKNETGSTIAAARIVYASGSANDVPSITLAKADSSATMPAIGVTIESIADGTFGRIMQVGLLENVNTSAYSVGDILYVSAATAGIPTGTAPTYPNIRQEIGTILVDSATVGSIQIVARSAFDDSVIDISPSLENPPTEDLATKAATSEWSFDHDAATTGVHGVGTGTVTSVSTANKNIYVDLAATGAADGTSWTDAYTTIQAAVDSMEDAIIHSYVTYVRAGAKKNGTADEDEASKLHDADASFASSDVGKAVFNSTDGTWGRISAFVDSGELTLDGDTFPDGNETYAIIGTPYREQVELNGDPATYPAHLVLGSVTIEAEYYWQGDCDTQANAGEILDATADFTNVEVGDKVYVLDLNGTNGRANGYEVGTVDDVSQVGSDIVRTTLTGTPTANWIYTIVKTEVSGSDDGLDTGTARNSCFRINTMSKVEIYGFYFTFSDSYALSISNANPIAWYNFYEYCDSCIVVSAQSYANFQYNYFHGDTGSFVTANADSSIAIFKYSAFNASGKTANYSYNVCATFSYYNYFDTLNTAFKIWLLSHCYFYRSNISANTTNGISANYNSSVRDLQSDNNATVPEAPAGTSEGAFIG